MAVRIKRHDTRPAYVAVLKENIGSTDIDNPEQVIDLTDADSVTFLMTLYETELADIDAVPNVEGDMDIDTDPTTGIVSRVWEAGDTAIAGEYLVEFQITWNDGGVETVPNGPSDLHADGYLRVTVYDDLSTS